MYTQPVPKFIRLCSYVPLSWALRSSDLSHPIQYSPPPGFHQMFSPSAVVTKPTVLGVGPQSLAKLQTVGKTMAITFARSQTAHSGFTLKAELVRRFHLGRPPDSLIKSRFTFRCFTGSRLMC